VEIVFLTKAVRGDRESRVMAMALGSTLLALFAFSGLGIPSANRVVPEMIYLAAMPAMMFGAMIWSRVLNFSRLRTVTTVLALFLLLVCGVRSIDEADELRSSQRLSNAVLQHEPDSFWAHQEKGLHAIRMFRIDRDPQRWGAGVLHLMNAARSSHSGGSIRPAVAAARVARLWSERSGLSSRRQARRWADQARKIQASRLEESRFQPGLQNGTLAWVEAADAWAAESEGRDEQAKSAMRQACLLEPSEAFWAVELGRILLRTKDFSKSREALDRAVKVDPECAQAYLLRAHLELEEGHITKALHEVGRAFEVANGGQSRSAAWLARASVHREMGQTDLAREAYRGYLAQGKEIQASERAQIHFELAEMEIVERLWSRALRELDQCLELDPGHIQARFREVEIRGQLIGKAFESLLEEAQEDFDAIRSEGARQASPYEVIANEGVRGSIEKRFDHLVEELVAIHKRAVSLTREKDEFIPLQKTVAKFLARLYVFQAGIRLRQGQKDLSQQLVKNALGLDPSCPEIREFRVDWMQVLSADVDEMEDQEKFTLYSKLLIRDPNHLAALKFFAGFWARKRNYGESERCYDRLIEILEPQGLQHWSSVQMEAGTCFFRWSRALRRGARRDEKRYGGSAFERHQRSQRYVGRAVAAFRKVLAISPSHYMARYNLGSLFYSLGDLNRAIEEYESILDKTSDLKKTLAEVYLKRYVRVRSKTHRIRDLEGYQKYASAPKRYLLDVLASLRAERSLEAGEFEKVLQMLDPLFKRRPVERWINLYLGQAHAALGNDGEALTHLGIATRKTPAPIQGLVALESVYQRQEKKEKQYRVLSRILKHRDRESCGPELMTSFQQRFDSLDEGRLELFRTGMRHLENENPKLAVEFFRKAHGYAPRDEQPLYYLGVAQRYSGEWVGAAKTLERLRRSHPDHPDGLFHLGVVYFRLDQLEKARRCFVDSLLASPPEGSSRQLEIERYLGLLRARKEKR
jgi:tetratricopeptide (TPR) repeat protein